MSIMSIIAKIAIIFKVFLIQCKKAVGTLPTASFNLHQIFYQDHAPFAIFPIPWPLF